MESGERSVEFHKWMELVTDMIATPGDIREEGGMAAKARSRMNKKLTRVNVDKRWREVVTGVFDVSESEAVEMLSQVGGTVIKAQLALWKVRSEAIHQGEKRGTEREELWKRVEEELTKMEKRENMPGWTEWEGHGGVDGQREYIKNKNVRELHRWIARVERTTAQDSQPECSDLLRPAKLTENILSAREESRKVIGEREVQAPRKPQVQPGIAEGWGMAGTQRRTERETTGPQGGSRKAQPRRRPPKRDATGETKEADGESEAKGQQHGKRKRDAEGQDEHEAQRSKQRTVKDMLQGTARDRRAEGRAEVEKTDREKGEQAAKRRQEERARRDQRAATAKAAMAAIAKRRKGSDERRAQRREMRARAGKEQMTGEEARRRQDARKIKNQRVRAKKNWRRADPEEGSSDRLRGRRRELTVLGKRAVVDYDLMYESGLHAG